MSRADNRQYPKCMGIKKPEVKSGNFRYLYVLLFSTAKMRIIFELANKNQIF